MTVGEISDEEIERSQRSRLAPIWFADVRLDPKSNALVKGLLTVGAFSVIYGEAGSGKSFFATDLALFVALGRSWRGRKTSSGVVIYIAAEGAHGMKRRLVAYGQFYALKDTMVPLAIIPTAVNLLDPDADLPLLLDEIRDAALWADMPVCLIAVDTLSRSLAGGEENTSGDMGALVANCDRIRNQTGAHVMMVHHSGKDISRGARGHSLLRAAADTEIEVIRGKIGEPSKAVVRKQRDGEVGDEFGFRLEQVIVGEDEDGDQITSCVVLAAEPASSPVTGKRLTDRQSDAIKGISDYFQQHKQMSLDTFRCIMIERGALEADANKGRFTDLRHQLERKGLIVFRSGQIRPASRHGITDC